MAIDCKNYEPKSVVQLLKSNPTFNRYIREGKNLNDILEFVKVQLIINDEQEAEIKKYHKRKNQ